MPRVHKQAGAGRIDLDEEIGEPSFAFHAHDNHGFAYVLQVIGPTFVGQVLCTAAITNMGAQPWFPTWWVPIDGLTGSARELAEALSEEEPEQATAGPYLSDVDGLRLAMAR